jgi:hypothetical protein
MLFADETIFACPRSRPDTNVSQHCGGQQRSSTMSAIITAIYREYCLARLAEIRKQRQAG